MIKELIKTKQAVCFLVKYENDEVLMVSRKHNPKIFGLPGGRVEDNETLEEACIREVFEETNLDLKHPDIASLEPILAQYVNGFWCTCFIAKNKNGEIFKLRNDYNIKQKEDNVIPESKNWDYFKNFSAFCDYNYSASISYEEYCKMLRNPDEKTFN